MKTLNYLVIALIILKLCHVINLSWWWFLIPYLAIFLFVIWLMWLNKEEKVKEYNDMVNKSGK